MKWGEGPTFNVQLKITRNLNFIFESFDFQFNFRSATLLEQTSRCSSRARLRPIAIIPRTSFRASAEERRSASGAAAEAILLISLAQNSPPRQVEIMFRTLKRHTEPTAGIHEAARIKTRKCARTTPERPPSKSQFRAPTCQTKQFSRFARLQIHAIGMPRACLENISLRWKMYTSNLI